jgi:hypothetical protein
MTSNRQRQDLRPPYRTQKLAKQEASNYFGTQFLLLQLSTRRLIRVRIDTNQSKNYTPIGHPALKGSTPYPYIFYAFAKSQNESVDMTNCVKELFHDGGKLLTADICFLFSVFALSCSTFEAAEPNSRSHCELFWVFITLCENYFKTCLRGRVLDVPARSRSRRACAVAFSRDPGPNSR